jgi:hypothetical protein
MTLLLATQPAPVVGWPSGGGASTDELGVGLSRGCGGAAGAPEENEEATTDCSWNYVDRALV